MKKVFFFVGVTAGIMGTAFYYSSYGVTRKEHVPQLKVEGTIAKEPLLIKKKIDAQKRPRTTERKCFSLQLAYGNSSTSGALQWMKNFQKKMEKLGFEGCHIREERNNLALLCNTVYTKKDLSFSINIAKRNGLDYQIRNDDCRFVVPTKSSTHNAKPKNLEKNVSNNSKQEKSSLTKTSLKQKGVLRSDTFDPRKAQRLFEERKSAKIALELARYYFAKKEFRQALYWAKKANAIDKDSEESWILYAKALYNLGKKEKAKRVLRIYLEYKESKAAQTLLKRWR